jgi:hypothetical protein
VSPATSAFDLAGPDDGGTLYIHGSVASPEVTAAVPRDIRRRADALGR